MSLIFCSYLIFCFFFHDTATTEIDTYCHTLSLHDALPIWSDEVARHLMIWLTFIGAGLTLRHGGLVAIGNVQTAMRSEEHTSELQSLMRISYAVFCLKKKTQKHSHMHNTVRILKSVNIQVHNLRSNIQRVP